MSDFLSLSGNVSYLVSASTLDLADHENTDTVPNLQVNFFI